MLESGFHGIKIMSFERQYIEKYGQKAVDTYKRSLKHSDVIAQEVKPSASKTQLKPSRSHSRKQLSNKSNKSKKIREMPLKSFVEYNSTTRQKGANCGSFHLSINPNPQRKKLIIGEMGTPKVTPNKSKRGNEPKLRGNTNVNVFVQAINRSKTKSKQSTPCKDLKKHKSSRIHKRPNVIVAQVISMLSEAQLKPKNQKLSSAIDLLRGLEEQTRAEDDIRAKLERKIEKIRELVCENQNTPGAQNLIYHKDKLADLQSQLGRYRLKQQSLLNIIESLACKGYSKKQQSHSSQEQDSSQ